MTYKPKVFIGSSAEFLEVAHTLHEKLEYAADPTTWTDGLFTPSSTAIESLEAALSRFEFALLLLSEDDVTVSRDSSSSSPRDNVVYELGLFMGRLGRQRVVMVKPRGVEIKMPSDLSGVTTIDFDPKKFETDPSAALTTPISKFVRHMKAVGPLGSGPLGVAAISGGRGRDDAFEDLRKSATQSIAIVGVAMHKLSKHGLNSLEEQATKVPIELLMLDPELVEKDGEFANLLEDFLRFNDIRSIVRGSFETLRQFAEAWNSKDNCPEISLFTYRSIPTVSLAMIDGRDDDDARAEMLVEFFMYQCGQDRPRLHLIDHGQDSLFQNTRREYLRLRSSARQIVGPA